MSSHVEHVLFVDGVEFKVWSDDKIAKVIRAWCHRKGLNAWTTVLSIPRTKKVVSVADESKVGDVCVQGERLVSIADKKDSQSSQKDRFEVWVKDPSGGQVVFVGTPNTLIRQLIGAACQRNCLLANGTLYRVERTGEILSVLDDRRWDQVLVKGDIVSIA